MIRLSACAVFISLFTQQTEVFIHTSLALSYFILTCAWPVSFIAMLAAVCRPRVCSTLSPAPANLVVALCGWRDFRTTASTQVRKDKILELAKGFRGRSKNCITVARARVEKGLQYAYRDRRNKKREFRSMWITRINAGVRGEIARARLLPLPSHSLGFSRRSLIIIPVFGCRTWAHLQQVYKPSKPSWHCIESKNLS
eukprot:SAG11_NODE_97_length_16960_cov_22.407405_12_plen_198_part_00